MKILRNKLGQFIKNQKPIIHKEKCKCFRCIGIVWNKGKSWSMEIKKKMSLSKKGKIKLNFRGEKNPRWKGNKVGYMGLHTWIKKYKGKAKKCNKCGSIKNIGWSNKNYQYTRDLKDWISLCQKCHMEYDSKNGWGKASLKFPELKLYANMRELNLLPFSSRLESRGE